MLKNLFILIFFMALFKLNTFSQNKFMLVVTCPKELSKGAAILTIYDYFSEVSFIKKDTVQITESKAEFRGELSKPSEQANLIIIDSVGNNIELGGFVIDGGSNSILIKKSKDIKKKYVYDKQSFVNSPTNQLKLYLDSLEQDFYDKNVTTDVVYGKNLTSDKLKLRQQLVLNVLAENPDNFYNFLELNTIINAAYNDDDIGSYLKFIDIINTFSEKLRSTAFGKILLKKLEGKIDALNRTAVGNEMPIFSVKTDLGKTFRNSSLKNEPYVVVFCATWCQPCQKELPKLIGLYQKYKDKGLKLVYFNMDDNLRNWKSHIEKNKLAWINVSEQTKFRESKIAKIFNLQSIPNYIVVNKQGRIVYNSISLSDYADIEKYLIEVTKL